MTKVLVCLLGLLAVGKFGNSAVAQESTHAPANSSALPCDAHASAARDCRSESDACKGNCFPASCCCDDYNPRPFPHTCFPTYPPWYKCVPAGDVTCCPQAYTKKVKRSWWFIPTCNALKEALWLDR